MKVPLVILAALLAIVGGCLKEPLLAFLHSALPATVEARAGGLTETGSEAIAGTLFLAGLYLAYVFHLQRRNLADSLVANPIGPCSRPIRVVRPGLGLRLGLRQGLRAAICLGGQREQERFHRRILYRTRPPGRRVVSMAERGPKPVACAGTPRTMAAGAVVFGGGGLADMILIFLIAILLLGGILTRMSARWNARLPRWISLAAIAVDLILAVPIWTGSVSGTGSRPWYDEVDFNWVPNFGIHFHLAVDGLSFVMLILTFLLGIVAVLCSWTEIRKRGV